MVPKPISDNAQKQRLTTALKNICRDYPAGGGVLRELLQNADDAGATAVRFHLDERTHPSDKPINPALAKYQGPALLAYNNAIFTEKDFESLSRLGDSLKLQDGMTTGKFGRGFNSVYNWTDSPAIVSRERLLILDPHEEWSTGGPVYDFVKDAEDDAIQNHMTAFQSVMESSTRPFNGTIIRIPLRTGEQASKSDICSRETTVLEVREVLEKFATEFGNSGLLFMRNIGKVLIDSTAGISISIEIVDGHVKEHKSKVNHAVKTALADPDYVFDLLFEVKIERRSGQESSETYFAVHHTICGDSMDNQMRQWARDQNLVPWVAIAVQLPYAENFQGSLFTVLPLPIRVNQPVLVHGLFCISPDRGRLYHLKEDNSQDQSPAKWNEWLLRAPIPVAWTKLLTHLAHVHPDRSTFEWWPQHLESSNDVLSNALDDVVEIVTKESLPLWSTHVGHVTASDGLLNVGEKSIALREALQEAKIPVVYVPDRLHRRIEHVFNGQILDPRRLSLFLINKSYQIRDWSLSTKMGILEYLLSKRGINELGFLELFPFRDGKYRSIADHAAFICRNEAEVDLFNLQDNHNIDFNKLSVGTLSVLNDWCKTSAGHKSIRYRSANDFRDYCLEFVFLKAPREQDIVSFDTEIADFVSKAWDWIVDQKIDMLGVISDLWFIPLTGGHHRKIKPYHSTSETIFAPLGPVGDFMRAFDVKYSSRIKPLLHTTGLSNQVRHHLITALRSDRNLLIKDGGNMIDFTQWLYHIRSIVDLASDEEKVKLVEVVAANLQTSLSQSESHLIGNAIGALKIFKKLSWNAEGDKMTLTLTWTSSKASDLSISLPDGMIAVPTIENIQFLDAPWSSLSLKLLNDLRLANCMRTFEVIEKYILPNWNFLPDMPYSSKVQIARVVFSQYSCLSPSSRIKLRALPIIPVARINGEISLKFSIAADLVDPSISALKELFFDDEEVIPESNFFKQFHAFLNDIGLKVSVDEALVSSRTLNYAKCNRPLLEIQKRVHTLLRSSCRWNSTKGNSEGQVLRCLEWLPVLDLEGTLGLKSPVQCRPLRDKLLVSSQLPLFDIPLSAEWEARLGWCDILPKDILLGQLKQGLQTSDRAVIDAILTYIVEKDQTALLIGDLQNLPCILTSSGLYVTASKAFQPQANSFTSCEGLHPYLGNVDKKFWQDHEILLRGMEIGVNPSLDHLLAIQKVLESQLPLSESDTAVAIEILRLASQSQRSSLTRLKVLSKDGDLCPVQEINYNDLGILTPTEKVNLTHPNIPLMLVKKLGIELLSDRLMKGLLEIADIDDEDEFEQHEEITTRIVDTLDRYPIDNTFREYLANADDTIGASKISWLLDERNHADKRLLTSQMKPLQGPALLVHNDGVFTNDDFQGFKNVGEGSKRNNKTTIGQFGRGSQTMYHWTDVPMILSGRYLLILDPQQEVLPKNQIKGKRKPGVKLLLSKLKDVCPDQLAPFEGLWGYNQNFDNYTGTIFRFPLRTERAKSKIRTSEKDIDAGIVRQHFETYFDEARMSLLFLRRIRSIDFKVYGRANYGWIIDRQESPDDDPNSFSQWAICSFTKMMASGDQIAGKDKWWVVIEDLQLKTDHLPYSPRRVMKNVECGVAGLVSSTPSAVSRSITFPQVTKPRMFSTLPLPLFSDLPVCIHATFSLSGDRRSLIIDEHGSESRGSEWNKYLLQSALPELYLSFLDDIGRQVRENVLRFWPQEDPPKRSCSELLCSSFWKQLPRSSGRFFPKDRPSSILDYRHPPILFDIRQAMFDFLPTGQSNLLAPLLLSLDVNLVRNIPKYIATHLKALSGVNSVTGQMLRNLFKSETSRLCLREEMSRSPHLIDQVLCQVIPDGNDFGELDGCHILPLADGSIGTLRFLGPSNTAEKYYIASEDEQKLFDFASGLLVSPSSSKRFDQVVSCEKFNLERLQLRHVDKLLERKATPAMAVTSSEEDEWLTAFWDYWNRNLVAITSSSTIGIDNFPAVFRVVCGSSSVYCRPQQLDELPAVVEPIFAEHQQLCDRFPKLWRFNSKFMPVTLRDNESSFFESTSFFRFVKALKALAIREGETLGVFVQKQLDVEGLEVFRSLIIHHASFQVNTSRPESQGLAHLKDDLRSLPLWPSAKSTGELVSASDSFIAETQGFLVPWMKQYLRFIDPQVASDPYNQNCIRLLGIQKVSAESLLSNYLLPLPSMSSAVNWSCYRQLIAAVSGFFESSGNLYTVRTILSQNHIAVDGNRLLRRTEELFDHEDEIFISAFRGQEDSKFLHSEVKAFRRFWLKVGLLHRENALLKPLDYIRCLQSLSQRLSIGNFNSDSNLSRDTAIVLSPLITPSSSTQNFNSHWPTISREEVFISRSNFNAEPEHRRIPMTAIAVNRPLSALSEVITYNHVAICWSQTPFTVHAPTTEVLSLIQGNGKPPVQMVWRHLDHLADMAKNLQQEHIAGFLHDLHCTYTYLQDHTEEIRSYFDLRRNKEVWLNINSSEGERAILADVKSSWNEIGDLVLSSSCDAGRIKAVRPGLMRYEKLLRALGCKSITYPTVTRPILHHGHSISASLRLLRAEKKLLDITYCTQGKEIQAHRVVLAAVSGKCAAQWSGLFPVEPRIVFDQNIDPDCFLSYQTLSMMIDYAYESEIDWSEMEASEEEDEDIREEKLQMLLELHKGAQYWLIPALMSQVEDKILDAGKMFINIGNVMATLKQAEYVGAKAVTKLCAQFIEENRDAVERASGGILE